MSMPERDRELGAAFAAVAGTYCRVVEGRSASAPAGFLAELQLAIPAVYAAGARLPMIEPAEEGDDSPGSTDAKMELLLDLEKWLGPYNRYWEVYDPAKPEGDEKLLVSLADDLSDIYFDLHEGLGIWGRGTESDMRNAVFEWRLGWETHWGAHAVDALRAIHWHLETHWLDAQEPLKPVPPQPPA